MSSQSTTLETEPNSVSYLASFFDFSILNAAPEGKSDWLAASLNVTPLTKEQRNEVISTVIKEQIISKLNPFMGGEFAHFTSTDVFQSIIKCISKIRPATSTKDFIYISFVAESIFRATLRSIEDIHSIHAKRKSTFFEEPRTNYSENKSEKDILLELLMKLFTEK